jgi:hypothetical protein
MSQNAISALHNAARHYCIERISHWHQRYATMQASGRDRDTTRTGEWTYSQEAYDVFPRYQVLAAILSDIEHYVPDDFESIEQLREIIATAAESAQNMFTTRKKNRIELAAESEERRLFAHFASSANPEYLSGIPLLPYRRVLGDAEHKKWHQAFAQRWGLWYGGCVQPREDLPPHVTLHIEAMNTPEAYDRLRAVISQHGYSRLLELRESGDGFELDLPDVRFRYTGAEGFWMTPDLSWMVYASHESSITFGGAWLVDAMRAGLPEFQRYIYKGWALEDYPPLPV